MALTVENNTGLPNADSYVAVTDLQTYCTNRGIDWTLLALNGNSGDTPTMEALCRLGFQYVNTQWVYKSFPLQNLQSGEFPRIQLSDGMGRIFDGIVPQRVKDAQCEAAIAAGSGYNLFAVAERGGQIERDAVGPISTSYFKGAPPDTFFQAVTNLLKVFARDPNQPRRPLPLYQDYSDGSALPDPVFSVGQMDNLANQDPSIDENWLP